MDKKIVLRTIMIMFISSSCFGCKKENEGKIFNDTLTFSIYFPISKYLQNICTIGACCADGGPITMRHAERNVEGRGWERVTVQFTRAGEHNGFPLYKDEYGEEIICCSQEGKWSIGWQGWQGKVAGSGAACDPNTQHTQIQQKGSMIEMGGLGGSQVEAYIYCT